MQHMRWLSSMAHRGENLQRNPSLRAVLVQACERGSCVPLVLDGGSVGGSVGVES